MAFVDDESIWHTSLCEIPMHGASFACAFVGALPARNYDMRATPLFAPQLECSLETRGEKRGGATAPKRCAGHDDGIYVIFWVTSMRVSVPIERGDAQ
ncbi:unknown [Collinsella sp. CAG:289]|nr:unknown [Collinsella sp. CAG:289]